MGGKVKKAVKSVTKSVKKVVNKTVGGALGIKEPKVQEVNTAVAPEAPDPEQTAVEVGADENISRRKRQRRNGLRIDLNNGGGASNGGSGLNIPVG